MLGWSVSRECSTGARPSHPASPWECCPCLSRRRRMLERYVSPPCSEVEPRGACPAAAGRSLGSSEPRQTQGRSATGVTYGCLGDFTHGFSDVCTKRSGKNSVRACPNAAKIRQTIGQSRSLPYSYRIIYPLTPKDFWGTTDNFW